jgi:hypothetical protein
MAYLALHALRGNSSRQHARQRCGEAPPIARKATPLGAAPAGSLKERAGEARP